MPISPARAAAFDILLRVETTDAYASELLHSARTAKLSPADHGLATEIVMGVLRWRNALDERTVAHISQPLAKLDGEVLAALRMGAYQLLFLDRVPAHAAIHESVELVKKAHKRSAAGMVNAVLRKIASSRRPVPGPDIPSPLSSRAQHDRSLAKDHAKSRDLQLTPKSALTDRAGNAPRAHPSWLVSRWQKNHGEAASNAICNYNQQTPATVIRAKAAVADGFAQDGITLEPGKLLTNAYVVVHGDIARTPAFRERRAAIQDEGSQLVALLLGSGQRILDCCAAPGGKTRILAEQNPNATVIAMEFHPRRAALLKRLVPNPNVHVVTADARSLPFEAQFDRILVDAPCTGTGTLARNPEIRWRLTPEDITRVQAYQIEILSSAIKQLSPGGRLLYSTCSLEPDESEGVIERILQANHGFRLLDLRHRLSELRKDGLLAWPDVDSLVQGPYLRTIPGVHPCDGFFAALLEREM